MTPKMGENRSKNGKTGAEKSKKWIENCKKCPKNYFLRGDFKEKRIDIWILIETANEETNVKNTTLLLCVWDLFLKFAELNRRGIKRKNGIYVTRRLRQARGRTSSIGNGRAAAGAGGYR